MFIRFGNANVADHLNAQRTAPGRWIANGSEEHKILEAERELREAQAKARWKTYHDFLDTVQDRLEATTRRRTEEAKKISRALEDRFHSGWFNSHPLVDQEFISWLVFESVDQKIRGTIDQKVDWVVSNKDVEANNPAWEAYLKARASYDRRRRPFTLTYGEDWEDYLNLFGV